MKTLIIVAAVLTISPLAAQEAKVKQPTVEAGAVDKLTIRECLGILRGLQYLDGRKVIIAQGKPSESVEVVPYKFGETPDRAGKVRDAISHNLFMLTQPQQEAESANRRIQLEIGKGKPIEPNTTAAFEAEARANEYVDRPCKVELDHIRDADLRLNENDIPGSVLALIWKIRDR